LDLFVVACDQSYYGEERSGSCVGESSIPPDHQRMFIVFVIRLLEDWYFLQMIYLFPENI